MVLITAFAIALAAPAAPCAGVIPVGSKGATSYVDFDAGHYIEYRRARAFVPPASVNPDGREIIFRLLINYRLADDVAQAAALTVEVRDRDKAESLPLPPGAEQRMTVAMLSGRPARPGPVIGGNDDLLAIAPTPPGVTIDDMIFAPPPGAAPIYAHLMKGGSVRLHYSRRHRDQRLVAEQDTAFPADPEHHAETRAGALAAVDDYRKSGLCPLHRN